MQGNFRSTPHLRRARAALWIAVALMVIALLLLARASLPRAEGGGDVPTTGVNRRLAPLPPATRPDLQPLLVSVAGRTLIRPAQVQAAVKADGTAERLLKQLKLQGVVRIGETPVAYIQIEKEGVKAVREGDMVLEFVVDRIESNQVVLSLQGVVVTLGHG
jgi:hypothetical protein